MTEGGQITIISRGDNIFAIIDANGNVIVDNVHGEENAERLKNSASQHIPQSPPAPSGPIPRE